MKLIHDSGISRLAGLTTIVRGKWYLGFTCTNCGANIYSLDDPSAGQNTRPIVGEGKFSVPCFTCEKDELIYGTADLHPILADKDIALSKAMPRRKPSNRPRQPATSRYKGAKPTFGLNFLEERPECAVIIARCIATWSYIETELALLLASILKINNEAALAMFLAIKSSPTQRDALGAAAQVVLPPGDHELFLALMNLKKQYENDRNDLAHGLFGGSAVVKEGILWMEQKYLGAHTATVWSSNYDNLDQQRVLGRTFVYEPADLETIAQNFEWLHQMIGFFRGYAASDNEPWRAQRYQELCSDRRITTELDKVRAQKQKSAK